jgi:hypothetical protein
MIKNSKRDGNLSETAEGLNEIICDDEKRAHSGSGSIL